MEEWNSAIEQAVELLGESFDTHDVIKRIAHRNQREYVAALANIDLDTPFQSLHSSLGKQIRVVCEGLGFTGEDSRSPDTNKGVRSCLAHCAARYFKKSAKQDLNIPLEFPKSQVTMAHAPSFGSLCL